MTFDGDVSAREGGGEPLVAIEVLQLDAGLEPLAYAYDGDAGADLRARVGLTLAPGHRALVPTGVALALPDGFAGFVHPRSGLAARHGITVLNAPGVIDSGYRGEVQVNLINTDVREPFTIKRGDRIAQLVIQRVVRARFDLVSALGSTERGASGHGSSGGFHTGHAPAREGM